MFKRAGGDCRKQGIVHEEWVPILVFYPGLRLECCFPHPTKWHYINLGPSKCILTRMPMKVPTNMNLFLSSNGKASKALHVVILGICTNIEYGNIKVYDFLFFYSTFLYSRGIIWYNLHGGRFGFSAAWKNILKIYMSDSGILVLLQTWGIGSSNWLRLFSH